MNEPGFSALRIIIVSFLNCFVNFSGFEDSVVPDGEPSHKDQLYGRFDKLLY